MFIDKKTFTKNLQTDFLIFSTTPKCAMSIYSPASLQYYSNQYYKYKYQVPAQASSFSFFFASEFIEN